MTDHCPARILINLQCVSYIPPWCGTGLFQDSALAWGSLSIIIIIVIVVVIIAWVSVRWCDPGPVHTQAQAWDLP